MHCKIYQSVVWKKIEKFTASYGKKKSRNSSLIAGKYHLIRPLIKWKKKIASSASKLWGENPEIHQLFVGKKVKFIDRLQEKPVKSNDQPCEKPPQISPSVARKKDTKFANW